jgi:hypothetical protein
MIGGGAFILLKSGGGRDETANQAEAGLAGFPQIACMELCAMASGAAKGASAIHALGCVVAEFRQIWLIRHKSTVLLFNSQF